MNRIKEVLEAKDISQTELANRLGKTFNMVNLYASNKVQPPTLINKNCANGEKRD
ncbi:MAG: helix-turn-helix transcriptional regulator [Prevotella sp.]|nr:helix-turn-helix transcriptional regulator [Prevotella sp.]